MPSISNHDTNGDVKSAQPHNPDFTFFLGINNPAWLMRSDVPMFLSWATIRNRTRLRSRTIWALDSGGYNELDKYGQWMTTPGQYAAAVRFIYDHVQGLQWAAIQDWVCAPHIIEKTGLSVPIHQQNTIDSYLRLCELQPTVPWVPVIQGWDIGEYIDHVRQYEEHGIDLTAQPIVPIGSIAFRQGSETAMVDTLIHEISGMGIKLHGFGVKTKGLNRFGHLLTSCDSCAWAKHAWLNEIKLPECTHDTRDCRGCLTWAIKWRQDILNSMSTSDPEPIHSSNYTRLRRYIPKKTPPTPKEKGYVECHSPNCEKMVLPDRWYCTIHWKMLPLRIRRQILRFYNGKLSAIKPTTLSNESSPELLRVLTVADEWIKSNHTDLDV